MQLKYKKKKLKTENLKRNKKDEEGDNGKKKVES